jgi:predicted DNA-binding transcriptional regulator AlpA
MHNNLREDKGRPTIPEALWRPPRASKYLSQSENRLAKLRVSGEGPPFIKIGKSVYYRKRDLDEWVERHLRTSTSEKG